MKKVNAFRYYCSIVLLILIYGCSHSASKKDSFHSNSEVTSKENIKQIIQEINHPLMPDLTKLGEAVALFWRLEERYPSKLEELRLVADEYKKDIQLIKIKDLSLQSMIYGRVLIANFKFPYPQGSTQLADAQIELNSINPEILQVSVNSNTDEAKVYLEEGLQVLIEKLESR